MIRTILAALALVGAVVFNTAFAAEIPPPALPNIDSVTPSLKASPITNAKLGTLEVHFEKTTLLDVRQSVRLGTIQHHGDAGGSQYWLCYAISHHDRTERLWLSSGELGGFNHSIEAFYVADHSRKEKPTSSCPELPANFTPVSLLNSLWIGTSSKQLVELLGNPTAIIDNWWIYSYSGKAGTLDRLAIFAARIKHGKIVILSESQVTTN